MRRIIDGTGRVLVTVGLLILLFVAYQLWGTGILEARSQDRLRSEFEQTLEDGGSTTSTTSTTSPTTPTTEPSPTVATAPTAPAVQLPANGDPVSFLTIPRLGMEDKVVVEGIDVEDLRQGPGHYPASPMPGQAGNVAVAGHRTTYGAPFGDLDQLVVGDEIVMRTAQGEFRYTVTEPPFEVSPDDGNVLLASDNPLLPGEKAATLTLTTCHPKFSAEERLIVKASLVLPPGAVPLPPTVRDDAPVAIAGLNGETASRAPAILWGAIVLVIGLAWWWLFHRYPRWYVWLAGAIPFFIVLFVFFTYFERLLPSSY